MLPFSRVTNIGMDEYALRTFQRMAVTTTVRLRGLPKEQLQGGVSAVKIVELNIGDGDPLIGFMVG